MIYKINAKGFAGKNLEAKTSFWSGPKLFVNGQPAPKGSKRGEMLLQSNYGKQVVARWKTRLMGLDAPQLVIGDQVINLEKPLKWYQWVWAGLPMAMGLIGGALGALAGLIGLTINAKVFRTEMKSVLKYIVSGWVSILAVAGFYVAATLLTIAIGLNA